MELPIRPSVPGLVEAMQQAGLSATLRVYEGETHASVLMPAVWDGMVALYGHGARR